MAHQTAHISESGIDALKAILRPKSYWTVFAPEVKVGFDGAPHLVDQLVFWVGRDDFVVLTTLFGRSRVGFDHSTYSIERSPRPGRISYVSDGEHPPHLYGASSLEIKLGEVERIEIIEACCSTTDPSDEDPETIAYDYGLQFFGASASLLLTTCIDSICGAIEIRKGAEPEPHPCVDGYRTRLIFDKRALFLESGAR
ncbi:MAG: hypothetical protein ACFB13_09095 [Kiloniellaceae bacterium]